MRHYVCIGDCVFVASTPGVCTTEGCTHEGKSLIACSCNDEMHDEAFAKATSSPTEKNLIEGDDEPSDDELMDIEEGDDSETI